MTSQGIRELDNWNIAVLNAAESYRSYSATGWRLAATAVTGCSSQECSSLAAVLTELFPPSAINPGQVNTSVTVLYRLHAYFIKLNSLEML